MVDSTSFSDLLLAIVAARTGPTNSLPCTSHHNSCIAPHLPLSSTMADQGVLDCQHRRDAGAMPPSLCFGAAPHELFAQQLALGSIFKHLVILSCLRGLPTASVGSPVLFLAPTLLLVQVLHGLLP